MLNQLLQKFGAYKIVVPLLAAGIISAPLPAYSENLFSRDLKKATFILPEENSNASLEQRIFPGIALHLETQPRPSYLPPEEPSNEENKAYYVDPEKNQSGKKPAYLNPVNPSHSYNSSPEERSHTGGWILLGSGLAVILVSSLGVDSKVCWSDASNNYESECHPSVIAYASYAGIVAGAGLSILGLWDVLSD